MLFLQSRIRWSFVDHFHYLVIQLIGKSTSLEVHNIFFSVLFLILFAVFHLFVLPQSSVYSTLGGSFFPWVFPDYFSWAFFFFSLHISCTSFSLFLRESIWAGLETLLELWQVLHLNFKGLVWGRESDKGGTRDPNLLFMETSLRN